MSTPRQTGQLILATFPISPPYSPRLTHLQKQQPDVREVRGVDRPPQQMRLSITIRIEQMAWKYDPSTSKTPVL